ncbi:UNVERIFIED_CONTAM: hypothetical protein Slati_4508000 [Sesamum latifolium]|uniref:Uncharacterized protein n=1 Tax=Sesamum latifolium TaxID=2727402 RepID=A0AAW2SUA3_9LAMI
MQTRSRSRDVHGVDTTQEAQLNEVSQAPPYEQSPSHGIAPSAHGQTPLNREVLTPYEQAPLPPHGEPVAQGASPQEKIMHLRQEALIALIHDVSTRAAAQAMTQFAAHHPMYPPLLLLTKVENYPRLLRRRRRGTKRRTIEFPDLKYEANNRVSRPEVAQTQEQNPGQSRKPSAPLSSKAVEDPYLPNQSSSETQPFSSTILAEALPAGVKE